MSAARIQAMIRKVALPSGSIMNRDLSAKTVQSGTISLHPWMGEVKKKTWIPKQRRIFRLN